MSVPDGGERIEPLQIPAFYIQRWSALVDTLARLWPGTAPRVLQFIAHRFVPVAMLADDTAAMDDPVAPVRHQVLETGHVMADTPSGTYVGLRLDWPERQPFGVIEITGHAEPADTAAMRCLLEQFHTVIADNLADIATRAARIFPDKVYRQLAEASADEFYVHDEQGRLLDVNARACLNTGYSRAELLARNVAELSPTFSRSELLDFWAETAPGTSRLLNIGRCDHSGATLPIEVLVTCLMVDGRKLFFAWVRPIAERVASEEAIRRLNAEFERRGGECGEEWRQSADVLQAVMDSATDAIYVKDLEDRFLLFNKAAARFAGRDSAEVLGRRAIDIFGRDFGDPSRRHELEVMKSGRPSTIEEVLPTSEGERLFLTTRSLYRDSNGAVAGLIGISRDITEKKRAEQALRDSEARWQFALDGSGDGVWDWNVLTGHVFYSRQWKRMLGYSDDEIGDTTDDWSDRIHPDDRERCWQIIGEHFAGTDPVFTLEHRMRAKDGSWRWTLDRGKIVEREADGTPTRVIVTHTDITTHKAALDALIASYQSLRQAEKIARIGSWSFCVATQEFSLSETLKEMIGIGPEAPTPTPAGMRALLDPAGAEAIAAAVQRCLATGEPYGVDVHHFRRDGTSFAAHIRGQANRDPDGAIVGLTGTVQDITEREEVRQRIAVLADNLPNGAIYRLECNPREQYELTYVSAGIHALIGISAEEIVNNRDAFIGAIHEDDVERYKSTIVYSLETQTVFDCQFRARRRDGRIIWMHCRSAPRMMPGGTTVWDGIMRDITIEREAAETLERAKEAAEAAERAKSDFLATMSHEIRTPMNTVIGMTRLTLLTDLAPKQRNYLEKIDASARTLLSIIDDVLDFSKIEAGRLELEDTEFTLESVLESVSAVTAMRAEEKGLEIAYAVAPEVPRQLRGDPLRLGQVLINLVGNAIKFTHEGEVVVTVSAAPGQDSRHVLLEFAVRDTGIGMTSAQMSGLFRPFAQADAKMARTYGGTGLGLAISEQIIALMGGTIAVESEFGQGSTFRFTVRLRTDPAAAATVKPVRHKAISAQRVLIVDDNASAREILRHMVEAFGLEALAVASGAEALSILRAASGSHRPFDLVLMDWRMPGMDGIETARRIRADASIQHMPAVLMVTAYGRDEVLQQIDQIGLQGLLIKPVTESVMFNTIIDTLPSAHIGPARRTRREPPSTTPRPPLVAQLAGKRALVVDDNPLNREVACGFIAAVGMRAETADNGIEALARLRRSPFDVVLMDVHMPEMDGLAAARAIRSHPDWTDLPIIALTAQARVEDRRASLDAGMTAHLTKPIDETALYETLLDALSVPARAPSMASSPIDAPTAASGTSSAGAQPFAPALDIASVISRFGGRRDRIARLLRGFVHDFADASAELDDHLRRADFAKAAALAHTVKGAASYLGARDFCAAAEAIEYVAIDDQAAVAAAARDFRIRLQELLTEVREHLDAQPAPQPSGRARRQDLSPQDPSRQEPLGHDSLGQDNALARALVARLEPLISRGDYAAHQLLDELADAGAASAIGHHVEALRAYFDELELDKAARELQQIEACLQSSPPSVRG
ncbi:PAS domain S-box protein [Chelatococcus asaccharovorans]|uniref:PAS domain S-box protein n=1 Tax=Chelatococcus asaccharovorans TaxID=28210 RepID=UPI00224C6694|nr:PAS domain S-box protein [Chelatococcus asaccharovorans]CAH1653699.1 Histidine kinase [Chelatococcus asaccharovorans]CAH1694275.1 Histidine kinase [Chelatococcus asaccharovorans]